jgi:hypothetical protein
MVVGSTPVGVAIASRLTALGCDVLFVGRKIEGRLATFRFEGWNDTRSVTIRSLSTVDASRTSLAFFALRAYDIEGALGRYLSYLPKGIPVIPCGPGIYEQKIQRAANLAPQYAWRIGLCTFTARHISSGIHHLTDPKGRVFWGPLDAQEIKPATSWLTPAESDLIHRDQGVLFMPEDRVHWLLHKNWLFTLVGDSVAVVRGYRVYGELLKDVGAVQEVFREGYRLGAEKWGPWGISEEHFLSEFLSNLATKADREPGMVLDLREGRKTLNPYLAKMALAYRGYPILKDFASAIEGKQRA